MENLKRLLERESVGLSLRVFAGKPELVEKQCEVTLALARKAADMHLDDGKTVFKNILLLVAEDKRRVDYDCGLSSEYLKNALTKNPRTQIKIISCKQEDLFCGTLNLASAKLLRSGCKYMAVFSSLAHDYLDMQFMEDASLAFSKGAVVAGLAIAELQQSILDGLIANTSAVWDIEALTAVGGFDQCAEHPFKKGHFGLFTDERLVQWVQGQRLDGTDGFYPSAGVEEIIPLIRLARKFDRQCIAPIMPSSGKVWEVPNDPVALSRHHNKMATKRTRQEGMAQKVNADLSVLKDAVMNGYKQKKGA